MRSTSLQHDYHERSPGIDWLYLGLLIFFAVNALLINFFLSHIQPTTVWELDAELSYGSHPPKR